MIEIYQTSCSIFIWRTMEKLEIILSLSGTIMSFIITLIVVIIKLDKWKKNYQSLEEETRINDLVDELMSIAETFNNYLGNEKKEYVITKLNQFAIENNIDFDKEKLDERIEKLIKLSKNVNYKKNNNDLKFELGKKDKE